MKKFDIDGFKQGDFWIKFNSEDEFKDFIINFNFRPIGFYLINDFPIFSKCIDSFIRIIVVTCKIKENHVNWSDYTQIKKEEKPDLAETKKTNKLEVFKSITDKMNKTYEAKNNDYGDSFTKVRNKYPNSIVIRLNDKLNRLESLMNGNKQMVSNESIDDTLIDMANYCIMELVEREIENERRKKV